MIVCLLQTKSNFIKIQIIKIFNINFVNIINHQKICKKMNMKFID